MSNKTATNLFMLSSLKRYAGFYQQLLYGISSFKELGNRLVREAEAAQAFRQFDKLKEVAMVLSNHPVREYQLIGQFYIGWCSFVRGENPQNIFEAVAEYSTTYKAKALISLAALEVRKGDTESELGYYREAIAIANTPTALVEATRGSAIVKAKEGFHHRAIRELESVAPIIRHANRKAYYGFLNSLAVELSEVGRKYEARNVIKHVLTSPFAFAYPEWKETGRSLRGANRSFVIVGEKPESKPVMPALESQKAEPAEAKNKPAGVLMFPHKLKEAPQPEKPDAVSPKELGEMTEAEKRGLLLSLIHSASISEQEYERLLAAAGLVKGGPAANEINLEDEALLEDIIRIWCNMIEPEQFAAVMSALRDCKDDWRRNCIIDQMIAIAFQQTSSRAESEHAWRLKVECRLPEK